MMTKKRWDDDDLKSMFGKLPEIKDARHPDDIFMQIQSKAGRRKRIPWKVVAASAAAVLSLAIITPAFLGGLNDGALYENSSSGDRATESHSTDQLPGMENGEGSKIATDDAGKAADEKPESAGQNQDTKITAADEGAVETEGISKSAEILFGKDLEGKSYFTIVAPTNDAQYFVPLTFLVEQSSPEALMEKLIGQMGNIQEDSYGLSDFLPIEAELRLQPDLKSVEVDLPADHPYKGREQQLIATIEETFRYSDIDSFTVSIEGNTAMEFGNYLLSEPFMIDRHPKRAIFLFKPEGASGIIMMAPSPVAYETIAEAIEAMKRGEEFEGIYPSIPEGLEVGSVEENGETLSVHLTGDGIAADSADNILALRAILLSARDFGFETVTFINKSVGQIGDYEMNVPIDTPVAPNLISDLP